MNPNPSASRDIVELWGREFNIVKNGLSEAQVISFVNDLAKQHDILLQRQEHLAALTKLAERTVSEADKLADELKQDARKQAKNETSKMMSEAETSAKNQSDRIISEAEVKAEQLIKEKEAHAMTAAAEQAEAIKSTAEMLATETKRDAEAEAKRIIVDAEARGRKLVEQKEAEAIAHASEKARKIIEDARKEASTLLETEKRKIQPELDQFVKSLRGKLQTELDDLKNQIGSLESQFEGIMPQASIESFFPPVNKKEKTETFIDLVKEPVRNDIDSEPEWEIEIVPPLDIMKIMSIVSYIDSLPEVVRTEIIPRNEKTSITVFTENVVELLPLVKELPEVVTAEETIGTGEDKKATRKITLGLSTNDENPVNPLESNALHDAAK
jgi:cell division septum initiation protein DivIVA